MNENIVRTETLYTYEAAINRYEREKYHAWLCNQRKLETIRRDHRDRRKYICNQKFIGLIIIVIDLLMTLVIGNLACAALALPGIALIVTNKLAIVNDYWWTHGGPEQWKEGKEINMKRSAIIIVILFCILACVLAFGTTTYAANSTTTAKCKTVESKIRKRYGKSVKIYDSKKLTTKKLCNRKNSGKIIVEKVIGIVKNAKTDSGGTKNFYISYKRVKGIRNGNKIVSYFVYNPKTNFCDDIIARYDVIIRR